jgi:predicted small lipoprotein YifL
MLRLHAFKLSVIAAVLAALLLAGCGKKGPLYLPDSPAAPGQKQSKN